ncbi:hypothetical protein WR25_20155 [Diploscapter pachys]|uniref:Uncharacterized protein n=1 Tax=Diploscapter pachys TaxID=2018661 RepID=A0A2A2KLU7_9BILA|nr:hypothetical protein WR25_20155 [Diploscapter pachys]
MGVDRRDGGHGETKNTVIILNRIEHRLVVLVHDGHEDLEKGVVIALHLREPLAFILREALIGLIIFDLALTDLIDIHQAHVVAQCWCLDADSAAPLHNVNVESGFRLHNGAGDFDRDRSSDLLVHANRLVDRQHEAVECKLRGIGKNDLEAGLCRTITRSLKRNLTGIIRDIVERDLDLAFVGETNELFLTGARKVRNIDHGGSAAAKAGEISEALHTFAKMRKVIMVRNSATSVVSSMVCVAPVHATDCTSSETHSTRSSRMAFASVEALRLGDGGNDLVLAALKSTQHERVRLIVDRAKLHHARVVTLRDMDQVFDAPPGCLRFLDLHVILDLVVCFLAGLAALGVAGDLGPFGDVGDRSFLLHRLLQDGGTGTALLKLREPGSAEVEVHHTPATVITREARRSGSSIALPIELAAFNHGGSPHDPLEALAQAIDRLGGLVGDFLAAIVARAHHHRDGMGERLRDAHVAVVARHQRDDWHPCRIAGEVKVAAGEVPAIDLTEHAVAVAIFDLGDGLHRGERQAIALIDPVQLDTVGGEAKAQAGHALHVFGGGAHQHRHSIFVLSRIDAEPRLKLIFGLGVGDDATDASTALVCNIRSVRVGVVEHRHANAVGDQVGLVEVTESNRQRVRSDLRHVLHLDHFVAKQHVGHTRLKRGLEQILAGGVLERTDRGLGRLGHQPLRASAVSSLEFADDLDQVVCVQATRDARNDVLHGAEGAGLGAIAGDERFAFRAGKLGCDLASDEASDIELRVLKQRRGDERRGIKLTKLRGDLGDGRRVRLRARVLLTNPRRLRAIRRNREVEIRGRNAHDTSDRTHRRNVGDERTNLRVDHLGNGVAAFGRDARRHGLQFRGDDAVAQFTDKVVHGLDCRLHIFSFALIGGVGGFCGLFVLTILILFFLISGSFVALFFLIGRRIVRLLVGLFDLVVRLEALGGERLGVFLIHAKLRELRHEIFFGDVAFGFGIGLHVRDTGLLVARKGDDADLHELGFGDRANTAFHGELDHPKADRETRHGTSLHGGVGVAPCCRVEKHAVGLQAVVVFLKLRPNADRHGPRIVVEEHGRDGPVGLVVRQRLGESAGGNDIARVVLIAEHCAIAGESLLRSYGLIAFVCVGLILRLVAVEVRSGAKLISGRIGRAVKALKLTHLVGCEDAVQQTKLVVFHPLFGGAAQRRAIVDHDAVALLALGRRQQRLVRRLNEALVPMGVGVLIVRDMRLLNAGVGLRSHGVEHLGRRHAEVTADFLDLETASFDPLTVARVVRHRGERDRGVHRHRLVGVRSATARVPSRLDLGKLRFGPLRFAHRGDQTTGFRAILEGSGSEGLRALRQADGATCSREGGHALPRAHGRSLEVPHLIGRNLHAIDAVGDRTTKAAFVRLHGGLSGIAGQKFADRTNTGRATIDEHEGFRIEREVPAKLLAKLIGGLALVGRLGEKRVEGVVCCPHHARAGVAMQEARRLRETFGDNAGARMDGAHAIREETFVAKIGTERGFHRIRGVNRHRCATLRFGKGTKDEAIERRPETHVDI